MKAEYGLLKKKYGEIKLFPETIDDLWHLDHLVAPGDLVFATTFRSLESATDKVRPEKTEKKPVRLGIKVEKVEFHSNANRLRISGVIEHGPDTGFHHTLNIETGHEISVIKKWKNLDLERIERSVKASSSGLIHVVTIEEGEAQIFRLRQYGPELVASLIGGSGKREGLDSRTVFFEDILSFMQEITGSIVIAGPGFIKEDFFSYLKSCDADTAGRCMTVETRRIGRGAVQDVIGLGVLNKITGDIQLAREVQLMDELLKHMGSDNTVAYGLKEVSSAVDFGAVKQILITDSLIRKPEFEELLEKAENMRAAIVVFSTEFDPGTQLNALGGIAALLRYPIK